MHQKGTNKETDINILLILFSENTCSNLPPRSRTCNSAILRRFQLYPLIELQSAGFYTTFPVLCRLDWHKQWFLNTPTEMPEDSSQETV
jgi:hypothetical protein